MRTVMDDLNNMSEYKSDKPRPDLKEQVYEIRGKYKRAAVVESAMRGDISSLLELIGQLETELAQADFNNNLLEKKVNQLEVDVKRLEEDKQINKLLYEAEIKRADLSRKLAIKEWKEKCEQVGINYADEHPQRAGTAMEIVHKIHNLPEGEQ